MIPTSQNQMRAVDLEDNFSSARDQKTNPQYRRYLNKMGPYMLNAASCTMAYTKPHQINEEYYLKTAKNKP